MSRKFVYATRRRFYLRERLRAKGWSQQKLADKMETDKSNITKWIQEPWRVTIDVLSVISDAMDLADAGALFRHPSTDRTEAQTKRLRDAATEILNSTE